MVTVRTLSADARGEEWPMAEVLNIGTTWLKAQVYESRLITMSRGAQPSHFGSHLVALVRIRVWGLPTRMCLGWHPSSVVGGA